MPIGFDRASALREIEFADEPEQTAIPDFDLSDLRASDRQSVASEVSDL